MDIGGSLVTSTIVTTFSISVDEGQHVMSCTVSPSWGRHCGGASTSLLQIEASASHQCGSFKAGLLPSLEPSLSSKGVEAVGGLHFSC